MVPRMGTPECGRNGRGLHRPVPAFSAGEMAGGFEVCHGGALGRKVGTLDDDFTIETKRRTGQR